MKKWMAVMVLPCALLIACGRKEPPPDVAPPTAAEIGPTSSSATAQANLFGASDSNVTGALQLTADGDAVRIAGELSGLPPGTGHGFHVHEVGDCSAPDASSAGEHLNPAHAAHGAPDASTKHLGDLPNVTADAQGVATVSATLSGATLRDGGPHDLVGKAFVVHEKLDDYVTQPAGDSGARIACGVVR